MKKKSILFIFLISFQTSYITPNFLITCLQWIDKKSDKIGDSIAKKLDLFFGITEEKQKTPGNQPFQLEEEVASEQCNNQKTLPIIEITKVESDSKLTESASTQKKLENVPSFGSWDHIEETDKKHQ